MKYDYLVKNYGVTPNGTCDMNQFATCSTCRSRLMPDEEPYGETLETANEAVRRMATCFCSLKKKGGGN